MRDYIIMVGIIFGVFALSFMMMNIRHILTGNEFRGTCATNNPMVKDKFGTCTVCGKEPGTCDNE